MEVKLKDTINNKSVKCGDVVVVNETPYLVISTDAGFIAKGFGGTTGSTGHHETLEGLYESFKKYDFKIYSKDRFELVLQLK